MPSDFSEESILLPAAVYNFLCWVHSAPDLPQEEAVSLDVKVHLTSPYVHCQVFSIGQDMLYSASHGHVNTPKHVSVSMAERQLTGGTQVIKVLKFGLDMVFHHQNWTSLISHM